MRMTNLRALREASGLSRQALAEKASVHSQTIAAHEYGTAKDVLYGNAKRLSEALGVQIEELFLPELTDVRIEMVPPLATA
jgi:DNA-binding XRE family transcriptional regulator